MKMIKTEFGLGKTVHVKMLKEDAIVIGIRITEGPSIEYQCRWFHGGEEKSASLSAAEIEMPVGRAKTGFGVKLK